MITQFEADVLSHTSSNGRYVTDDKVVIEMAASGLLHDYGPQPLAGGMHYLVMNSKGRSELGEWKSAQPVQKIKKKRISKQFESWRNYCSAYQRIPFPEFLKEVWPYRESYNFTGGL